MTIEHLPARRLIGRDALLSEIREHIQENVLIFSGTGEAGIGTTAVARSAARSVASAYPDGCIWINLECGGTSGSNPLTPMQVQRQVLRRLHVVDDMEDFPDDPPALHRMYQSALSRRKVLLILDDADSAAQLRHLLPQEGSAAIITTRHNLTASYPKLFTAKVKGLPGEDARHLIGEVSPAASGLSYASMMSLVTKLGGAPLALRVIAPLLGKRHPSLSPKNLLANLNAAQKRFSALRGVDYPSQNAHIAIEVAYEALDSELKPYFEGLGVFPAPFTARAAATVWNVLPARSEEILTQLAALALLDTQPESCYYELHPIIRLYAQELLLSQPETAREMVSRYVEHFMREVIQASVESGLMDPERVAQELDPHILWEHLPAAWMRAVGDDPGWPQPQAMQRWVCDFPLRSKALLRQSLSRDEYRRWVSSALDAAQTLGDKRVAIRHLGELGQISAQARDHMAALGYFEQQARAASETAAEAVEAEALMNAGVACGALGQISQAETYWQRALTIFEQVQDQRASRIRIWLGELRKRFGGRP